MICHAEASSKITDYCSTSCCYFFVCYRFGIHLWIFYIEFNYFSQFSTVSANWTDFGEVLAADAEQTFNSSLFWVAQKYVYFAVPIFPYVRDGTLCVVLLLRRRLRFILFLFVERTLQYTNLFLPFWNLNANNSSRWFQWYQIGWSIDHL